MDPTETKVAVRLDAVDRAALQAWAEDQAEKHPALRGRLFRMDGTPKMSTVLRIAAMKEAAR